MRQNKAVGVMMKATDFMVTRKGWSGTANGLEEVAECLNCFLRQASIFERFRNPWKLYHQPETKHLTHESVGPFHIHIKAIIILSVQHPFNLLKSILPPPINKDAMVEVGPEILHD